MPVTTRSASKAKASNGLANNTSTLEDEKKNLAARALVELQMERLQNQLRNEVTDMGNTAQEDIESIDSTGAGNSTGMRIKSPDAGNAIDGFVSTRTGVTPVAVEKTNKVKPRTLVNNGRGPRMSMVRRTVPVEDRLRDLRIADPVEEFSPSDIDIRTVLRRVVDA